MPMPRVRFSVEFGYAGLFDSSALGAMEHDYWVGKDSMAATLLSISLSRRRRCKWIRSHVLHFHLTRAHGETEHGDGEASIPWK
jgi:hypothetical protein